jgi:hypothetical protein
LIFDDFSGCCGRFDAIFAVFSPVGTHWGQKIGKLPSRELDPDEQTRIDRMREEKFRHGGHSSKIILQE